MDVELVVRDKNSHLPNDDDFIQLELPRVEKLETKQIEVRRDLTKRRDVYSWFEITLRSVDVVAQNFTCSIEIHCFWQDYSVPLYVDLANSEPFELDYKCVPIKMDEIFENKLDIQFEIDPCFSYLEDTSTIYMMFGVEVVFTESFELERFPLDRQFLNMKFNAWVKEGNWNWVTEYPNWVPKEFHKPFASRISTSITEYALKSPWVDFTTDQPLIIRLRVERKPEYFLSNIVFPNFIIVSSCFSDFIIPTNDASTRLGITITLMLASVAFRFIVATMLPKLQYLTLMDFYIMIGFVGLFIFVIENCVAGISKINNEISGVAYGLGVDGVWAIIFAFIWFMLHIVVLILIYSKDCCRVSWKKMQKLNEETDTDDDFFFCERLIANDESPSCVAEWEKYKRYSPKDRATMYKNRITLHSLHSLHYKPEENGIKEIAPSEMSKNQSNSIIQEIKLKSS